MNADPDDRKTPPRPDDARPNKEPTHAPGEDAVPGRGVGKKPYPVDDPGFGDPAAQPGAEPDFVPGKPAGNPPTF